MTFRTAVIAAAAAIVASTAVAAEPEDRYVPPAKPGVSGTAAATGRVLTVTRPQAISAPNVRVAITFDARGAGSIVRSKNVTQMINPSAGLYCIRVSGFTNTTVNRMVPSVTPFYEGSEFTGLFAYFAKTSACANGEIAVRTRRLRSGSAINSDFVGFTMTAP
jgi:hypothetical protein